MHDCMLDLLYSSHTHVCTRSRMLIKIKVIFACNIHKSKVLQVLYQSWILALNFVGILPCLHKVKDRSMRLLKSQFFKFHYLYWYLVIYSWCYFTTLLDAYILNAHDTSKEGLIPSNYNSLGKEVWHLPTHTMCGYHTYTIYYYDTLFSFLAQDIFTSHFQNLTICLSFDACLESVNRPKYRQYL